MPEQSEDQQNMPLLGYWNIRGNAQPIRLLLAYTKTQFRERSYKFGKQSDEDRAEWLKEKFNLDLDFPNLPYYIEGELKLTQSLTILHFLAERHGLAGTSEEERIRIDIIEQQLRDWRNQFIDATLDKNFEKARLAYLAQLPDKLRSLSAFLERRPYFAGNSISFVDFMAYEYIDQHFYLYPELFERLPNMKQFLRRVEQLPTIREFQYSEKYIRWPSGLLIPWYQAKYYTTFHRSVSDKAHDHVASLAKCQKIIESSSS